MIMTNENQNKQQQNLSMGDKELLSDSLNSQKFVTGAYNNYANESANEQLRSSLLDILQQEHKIQAEIFGEMQKRGWYQVQQAEMQQIDQAKQKYQQSAQQQQ